MRRFVLLSLASISLLAPRPACADVIVTSGPALGQIPAFGPPCAFSQGSICPMAQSISQSFTVPDGVNVLTSFHLVGGASSLSIFTYLVQIAGSSFVRTSVDPITHVGIPLDFVLSAPVVPNITYSIVLTVIDAGFFFDPHCNTPGNECFNEIALGIATPGVNYDPTGLTYTFPHTDVYSGGAFNYPGHPNDGKIDLAFTATFTTAPEPSTITLVASGLLLIVSVRGWRMRALRSATIGQVDRIPELIRAL